MQHTEAVLFLVKLCLSGFIAFLAILLWSKTGDPAWMSMIAGTIVTFAGNVFSLLEIIGILHLERLTLFGLPLFSFLFTVIPGLFFILSFLLMILRYNKNS